MTIVVRSLNDQFPVVIGQAEVTRSRLIKEFPIDPFTLIETEICKFQHIVMKDDLFYLNGKKYDRNEKKLLPWMDYDHGQIFVRYDKINNPRPSVRSVVLLLNF